MPGPHAEPYWPWCAQPGAARQTKLNVDSVAFGDGYVHRSTRGLNPARPTWTVSFPFKSLDELTAMDAWLVGHAASGFWFTPPDATEDVFVVVDEWSASIVDKNLASGIVGSLNATFMRLFNPQPSGP